MSDLRIASRHNGASHSSSSLDVTQRYQGRIHPLTAAVQLMPSPDPMALGYARTGQIEGWQEEVWSFYESLGEYNYGVEWFAQALSRCRLNVAELSPGGDEPEVIKSGPATDIIEQLAGGTDGQSAMMKSFAVQLSGPGECFLVGNDINELEEMAELEAYTGMLLDAEPDESGHVWTVQPINTMRQSQRTLKNGFGLFKNKTRRPWELQVDEGLWIPLGQESLVARVWDRNEHFPWRASSPGRAALPAMREIDMYNRYIMATLISRVALNGVWLIPEEVVLPANPAYEDQQDPFFAELLDVMRSVIKNPGSAASAAPLPLRVPADLIDKFKHMTFATPLDDQIFTAREGAIRRLAASLNLPQEVMTGMGSVNHWSAAMLEESAIKIHIAPKMEIITRCLTVGYLYPMLRAVGEPITGPNGGRIIVWYDTSQLSQRPDRSDLAIQLNDRLIITDEATRRETGFTEGDKPEDDERNMMIERKLVLSGGQSAPAAYKKLTGEPLSDEPPLGMFGPGTPGRQEPVAGNAPPNSGPGGGTLPATGQPDNDTSTTSTEDVKSSRSAERPPKTRYAEAPEASEASSRR